MTVSKKLDGATLKVSLEGRLDTLSAPQLETEISEIPPGVTAVELDFANIAYISSAGLRVLLSTHKKMLMGGGTLTITNAVPAVREVFDITGFSGILTLA